MRRGGRRRCGRCAHGLPPPDGAVPALPGGPGRPGSQHGSRAGVLHRGRPAPAQRAGERDERLPARPGALLPLGPRPPRPGHPAPGLRAPAGVRRLRRGPARRPRRSTPATPASSDATSPWPGSTAAATGSSSASPPAKPIATRAVVLATGARPSADWAPAGLVDSDRFVDDPWTGELPDGDLLLVGTGLTMVDVAIAADRPGRTLHTVSRHDLVPEVHLVPTTPTVPPPPGITRTAHPRRAVPGRAGPRRAASSTRPVTGARRSTACARSPPSCGRASTRTTSDGSWPTTPGAGTSTATGCRR